MNNNDPSLGSEDPNRRSVTDPIQNALENGSYQEFKRGKGLLTLDELKTHPNLGLDYIETLAQKIGWPDASQSSPDLDMALVGDEISDLEFMEALLPQVGDSSIDKLSSLVNFLLVTPTRLDDDGRRASKMTSVNDMEYGSRPYFLRAYAVAPDLIDGLKQRIEDAGVSAPGRDLDQVALDVMLEDVQARRAFYMFYRIMGRLVKVDDRTRQMHIEGYDNEILRPFASVDEAMRF